MVTETHNQINKTDNRALWTLLAIIVAAFLVYAAYASHTRTYTPQSNAVNGTTNGTTSGTTTGNPTNNQ